MISRKKTKHFVKLVNSLAVEMDIPFILITESNEQIHRSRNLNEDVCSTMKMTAILDDLMFSEEHKDFRPVMLAVLSTYMEENREKEASDD